MARKTSPTTLLWILVVTLFAGFVFGFLVARVRYKTQLRTTAQIVKEKVAELNDLKEDRILIKNGQMLIRQDGLVSKMQTDVLLSDGTRVTTKGEIIRHGMGRAMFLEGQSMTMDGKIRM